MQYQNVPAVHIKGMEGEVRYDWQNRLQLSGNLSFQDARDQQQYKTDGNLRPPTTTACPTAPGCSAEPKQAIRSTT